MLKNRKFDDFFQVFEQKTNLITLLIIKITTMKKLHYIKPKFLE